MGDEDANWFCLEDQAAVKFALKHKPRFVELPDGRTVMEIHPEDAHLFDECEIISDPPKGAQ